MPLPEGRVPLTDEEIAKILELCESPPPMTEYMKEMIKKYRNRESKKDE